MPETGDRFRVLASHDARIDELSQIGMKSATKPGSLFVDGSNGRWEQMNTGRNETLRLSWAVVGIYAVWAFGLKRFLAPYLPPLALGVTEQLLLASFFVAHALRYYPLRTVAFYGVVSTIVCNVLENLSVLYGFSFGYYVHNGVPKLFNVPYLVTLVTWAWAMFPGWLRRCSCDEPLRKLEQADLRCAVDRSVRVHVLGSLYRRHQRDNLPVVCVSESRSVVRNAVSNYFGWLLTTYLIYLALSLYLRSRGEATSKGRTEPGTSYWLQPSWFIRQSQLASSSTISWARAWTSPWRTARLELGRYLERLELDNAVYDAVHLVAGAGDSL